MLSILAYCACQDTIYNNNPDTLKEDIKKIDFSYQNLEIFPNLLKFDKLEEFESYSAYIPIIPTNLVNWTNLTIFKCNSSRIEKLPKLSHLTNLKILDCSYNKLTSLPVLPEQLEELKCSYNKLVTLPSIGSKLTILYSGSNNLIRFVELNINFIKVGLSQNPVFDIIGYDTIWCWAPDHPPSEQRQILDYNNIRKRSNILNRFVRLFYSIKFKKQFKKWLLKAREPLIKKKYSPNNLIDLINNLDNPDEEYIEAIEKW